MEKIKKFFIMNIIAVFVFIFCASAVWAYPAPRYPLLFSDGGGVISYDATNMILKVKYSVNLKANYTDAIYETILPAVKDPYWGVQDFYLAVKVDNSGVLDPTWHEAGHTYHDEKVGYLRMMTPDTSDDIDGLLLAGDVTHFGYEAGASESDYFFFTVEAKAGGILDIPLPGDQYWPSDPQTPTACLIHSHPYPTTSTPDFDGSWTSDWDMGFLQIKQFPVPEPSTIILLGFGLLGLLGIMRRKKA